MARIRSVHPDITCDEVLAEVSARAERTFVRLWTHLDDEGRCLDNVKLVKAALYPLHDDMTAAEVDRDLDELVSHGLLLRYETAGKKVIAAKPEAWHNRQKPKHPSESKLPGPPDTYPPPPHDEGTPHDNGGSPTPGVGEDYPESLRGVVDGEGVGVGGERDARGESSRELALVPDVVSSPPATVSADSEFALWWQAYPRKVGKPSALRAWRTARKHTTAPELHSALESWKATWTQQRRPVDKLPHASTWLNDRRWEDPPEDTRRPATEPKGFAGIRAMLEAEGAS